MILRTCCLIENYLCFR